ncbi:hypothetical protein [Azohydromonas aeria]|uniref:hypothetical protein n=1 Tax=Azohydromonas aeria TaxID=2590212 RepID=UPI0012FB9FC3|nr:hypothetical protein [Azohydromonas aeria]
MTIRLPDRPGRYGFGTNMPVGRINMQELVGGSFTVTRVDNCHRPALSTARSQCESVFDSHVTSA